MRRAFRQFLNHPAFSIVVTLSLALGIGANLAVFTAIDSLLFKSLPVRHAENLVQLDSENRRHSNTLRGFSFPGFQIMQAASGTLLSGVFAYTDADTSSSINAALGESDIVFRGNSGTAKGMLASAKQPCGFRS